MSRLALRSRAEGVGSSPFRSLPFGKRGLRRTSALIGVTLAMGGLLVVTGVNGPARAASASCPTVASDGTVTPAPAPGVDWSGCWLTSFSPDLANANLTGANLSGIEISGANLSGATLAGANLSGAVIGSSNLTGASLASADLTGGSLVGDSLAGASLSGATLASLNSYRLTGTPTALPANWALAGGVLVGPGAELKLANLAGADLAGRDLAGADFLGASLSGASLSGADLSNANLSHAVLAGADLTGASLTNANFYDTELAGANLSAANLTGAYLGYVKSGTVTGSPAPTLPADWTLLGGYLMGPGASLDGANLTGLDLAGVDLSGAILTAANFDGLDLSGADLTDANLRGATVQGAQFAAADITGVSSGQLTGTPASLPAGWMMAGGYLAGPGASLASAQLPGAGLAGGDLEKANLSGANLTGANLSGADITGANLSSAVLTSASLVGVDLSRAASLSGLISGGITQPPVLPAHWLLVKGYLVGPGADLTQASLSGANLSGADLEGTNFGSADLTSANLSRADLAGAGLGGGNFTNANLSGVTLDGQDLEGANLSGANLTNASLTAVTMTVVNVSGADFAGATLTRLFYEAGAGTGTPAVLPAHWSSAGGFLLGPTVEIIDGSLKGANLHAVDLENAYLNTVDLTGADLDGANLANANLFGSTLTGASMTGTIWSNTFCPDSSNSNKHVHGCTTPLDTTPPVVTVSGVTSGHVYVYGTAPAPKCQTTDNGTVATAATLRLARGANGAGRFTATCAGAVDLAGNKQGAPVTVSYAVVYGVGTLLAPANGATISRSSRVITAELRLAAANGASVTGSVQESMAAGHDVRVTLRGPGVSGLTVNCGWTTAHSYLACAIHFPSGVRTGSASTYTITVTENVGTGFLTVPAVHGGANPIRVHFR